MSKKGNDFLNGIKSINGDKIKEVAGSVTESVSKIDPKEVIDNVAKASKDAYDKTSDVVGDVVEATGEKISDAGNGVKDFVDAKKGQYENQNYKSLDSLQPVVNVVNESAIAIGDTTRTIKESAIPEVVAAALGAGAGGAGSFMALYGLGTVGLSAAGIASGLATAGALVGGGMAAGVFVLAAPVAILATTSALAAVHLKEKQLRQEKERLYQEVLRKHDAIIEALKEESEDNEERIKYLNGLNILLQKALNELKQDLSAYE